VGELVGGKGVDVMAILEGARNVRKAAIWARSEVVWLMIPRFRACVRIWWTNWAFMIAFNECL